MLFNGTEDPILDLRIRGFSRPKNMFHLFNPFLVLITQRMMHFEQNKLCFLTLSCVFTIFVHKQFNLFSKSSRSSAATAVQFLNLLTIRYIFYTLLLDTPTYNLQICSQGVSFNTPDSCIKFKAYILRLLHISQNYIF